MPALAPFSSQNSYPALYLYPLNDSFVPKHIALHHAQRVKIGRQTNAKTAPGERNGYFDSKVLSRQHAEVWEEGNKIYIKDVKSSNGTFINGDRLSGEGVESEPWELHSDDIVEFGIDIVGEDNKTIIHHKVAARAVCVFSEQDVQVAARAEQHQQQHQQQYQQQSQSQSSSSMLNQPGPSSNGPGSSFNFVSGQQQRRPQLPQQGVSGMGSMGGSMRPPGKSGLTFDHILSRLQGELQKSRETGAELHNLTGSMNEIHDTLGGNLPPNLLPYPHTLPPVRPPPPPPPQQQQQQQQQQQPQQTSATSATIDQAAPTDQVPQQLEEATAPADPAPAATAVLADLRTQLQDTQSSLAAHVDKIRALEGVLAEQEAIRQEMRALRDLVETRRREIELEEKRQQEHEHGLQGEFEVDGNLERDRGGMDEDDGEERGDGDDDDDDDTRSVHTVMPHELESVEEEDEEQLAAAADEDDQDRFRDQQRSQRLEDEQEQEEEEIHRLHEREIQQERREREDEKDDEERRRRRDELGRPRTPEPTRMGMRNDEGPAYEPRSRASTLLAAPRRTSALPSPLKQQVPSETVVVVTSTATPGGSHPIPEEVYEQLVQLSKQVGAVMALTSTLEAQHTAAQSTILALESKVESLEATLRATQQAQNAPATTSLPVVVPVLEEVETQEDKESLTRMLSEWKKSVEGQWSSVQEEWKEERERLSRAREEWEGKSRQVDVGLERMASLQSSFHHQQQQSSSSSHSQPFQQQGVQGQNGDAVKHSGLVTPPSPRSLSADSNRHRSRRRRSSAGALRGRSGSRSSRSGSRDGGVDTDSTLASEDLGHDKFLLDSSFERPDSPARLGVDEDEGEQERHQHGKGVRGDVMARNDGASSLATPEWSVHAMESTTDGDADPLVPVVGKDDIATAREISQNRIHLQAAVGVLVLSVAAAAVIWRVKPE